MPAPASDRNLLFGILALQLNFVGRDALLAAMNAWILDKHKPLGLILVEQGRLAADRRQLLEALVDEHVRAHGGDPRQSLAALSSVSSARDAVKDVADPDVQHSLAHLTTPHTPAPDPAKMPTTPPDNSPLAGRRFRVLRPHAKGGLGEVFVARDEELGREVALKEIQPQYADDTSSRARFLVEAEITGGLEHPGIVPVYSLGTYGDGRPYYAMRLIKGDNLMEAIDHFHAHKEASPTEHNVAFRELLNRFIDACQAMAYAHSRGILHRDLKPGNVMLGAYGETLVVDWGLAKSIGRPLDPESSEGTGEPTLRPVSGSGVAVTQPGQALGTPAYMSPEQAMGRIDDLGPATDVYSLGATLYVLLTGRAPFNGRVEEVIRKVERGDFARPRHLRPEVPKALEAICLKAMALRPESRYASPRALADEVEHWLADEPVNAFNDPFWTTGRRWMKRHQILVAAASVLLLLAVPLAVALAVVSDRARRRAAADTERITAEQEKVTRLAARRQKVSGFYETHVLKAPRPKGVGVGRDVTLREALDKARAAIAEAFADEPEDEAAVSLILANTYSSLSDFKASEPLKRRALLLHRQVLGVDHRDTLETAESLIRDLWRQDKIAEAERLVREYLSLSRAALGEEDPQTLGFQIQAAAILEAQSRHAEEETILREVLTIQRRLLGSDQEDTCTTINNLAGALYGQGKFAEAEEVYREVVEIERRVKGPRHLDTLETVGYWAVSLIQVGRPVEAQRLLEEALTAFRGCKKTSVVAIVYKFGLRDTITQGGLGRVPDRQDPRRRTCSRLLAVVVCVMPMLLCRSSITAGVPCSPY